MTSPAARLPRDGSSIQSVDRALLVLKVLARRGEVGVSGVSAELGVHKSTAFRLLTSLERHGVVEQNGERGTYRLGVGLLDLAGAVPIRADLVGLARPLCRALADALAETVHLAVARDGFAVNLDQVRGPSTVTADNWVGRPTPLHATSSGKVLLAWLPDERVRELGDNGLLTVYTERTTANVDDLVTELERVRAAGYALTLEEYEIGLNAVAAPIRNRNRDVVAALSVSGPAYRFNPDRIAAAVPALLRSADDLSHRAGHLD